jgi:hypothetical protein
MAELSRNHWTMRLGLCKQRVTTAELRDILLKTPSPIFCNGRSVRIAKRSLGAGVYEIWFEQET